MRRYDSLNKNVFSENCITLFRIRK